MLINRGCYFFFFWYISALQDAAANNVLTNKKGMSCPVSSQTVPFKVHHATLGPFEGVWVVFVYSSLLGTDVVKLK